MSKVYGFSSFRLDPESWRLSDGMQLRPLRPKTFELLRHLLDNAGRLVSKEDLLAAVWPGIKVTDSSLSTCMNELRHALDDKPQRPRFVETVHRRGYRFIAPVATTDDEVPDPLRSPQSIFVGREEEKAVLHDAWTRALDGAREVLFVTGEPGIGKTTLVDHFLGTVQSAAPAAIGRGQCAELLGDGEAFLPIIDALSSLCRGSCGKEASEVLLRRAPAWSVLVPQLRETAGLKRAKSEARPARMMGEIAAALEAIAESVPLILVCEDLHGADRSTLDLIAYLAKHRSAARLMMICTYRSNGPRADPPRVKEIVRELRVHRQCRVLRLKGLTEIEIAEYMRRRDAIRVERLAREMHARTAGNALFMAAIADQLETMRGAPGAAIDLRRLGVPDNIHDLIEHQIEQLPEPDRKLLQAASVAAMVNAEFSSASLAAALELAAENQEQVEEEFERLTRDVHFLHPTGVMQWPDGTVAAAYGFRHSLYQEVLYAMMGAGIRARTHLRIAKRLETAYGARAPEIAAELAMHFERGGDYRSAVTHLAIGSDSALDRGANREALERIETALKLCDRLPNDEDRLRKEVDLETKRMAALGTLRMPSSRIEAAARRIAELARGQWSPQQIVLQGLFKLYSAPREARAAQTLVETGLRQLESLHDRAGGTDLAQYQSLCHWALGYAANLQGRFMEALSHADRTIETYDPEYQPASFDTKVQGNTEGVASLWHLGYPDEAKKRALHAIEYAERISHAPAISTSTAVAATLFWHCREWNEVRNYANKLIAFTADKDFPYWRALGEFLRGSAVAGLEDVRAGCTIMRAAIVELDILSADMSPPLHILGKTWLQVVEANAGFLPVGDAIRFVQEQIDDSIASGLTGTLAHYYHLMGLLRLKAGGENPNLSAQATAEKWFRKSLETARSQAARSLELRASMELARLWQRQGKTAQARKMLAAVYGWFKEGRSSPDLEDAKKLIAELK